MPATGNWVKAKSENGSHNGKTGWVEFPGFHNPFLNLRHTLESFLFPEEDSRSFSREIGYDLEDLYYTALFAGWRSLQSGFTSLAIVLDGNFILPGGVETVAQALQDIGVHGWVGNQISREQKGDSIHLAWAENYDFLRQQKIPSVKGVLALEGVGRPGAGPFAAVSLKDLLVDRLYCFQCGSDESADFQSLLTESFRVVLADEVSFTALSLKQGDVPAFLLWRSENESNSTPEKEENSVVGIPVTRDRITSPNPVYFLSSPNFWKSQFTIYRNPDLFFPFPIPTQKELVEQFTSVMGWFRDSKILVQEIVLNDEQIVRNRRLTKIPETVIQHEFDHIVRKLKRMY